MDDFQAEVEIMIAGTVLIYIFYILFYDIRFPLYSFDQNHLFAEKD